MDEILIKLRKETLLEIIRQIPPDELETITREALSSPLRQQLERAQNRAKPFCLRQSKFFALSPVDIGPTSAEDIDKIIAEDAYKGD